MQHDGNGWVRCACGHRHWGKFGAAGLFLRVDDAVLIQLRPDWAHQGGSWAIPGGARDSHESVIDAALREAAEEAAIDPDLLRTAGVHRMSHPDWHYDTVIATAQERPPVTAHAESVELRWVGVDDLGLVRLHPGFEASLPELLLPRVSLVIDAANVFGSTPDGWWHDRAGAAERLSAQVGAIAGRPVLLDDKPTLIGHLELVVEGQAVAMADPGSDSLVRIVRASAAGDDTIAERARSLEDALVVTSDRGLRARVGRSVPVSELWRWMGR